MNKTNPTTALHVYQEAKRIPQRKQTLWTAEDRKITQGETRALAHLLAPQAEITRVRQGKIHEGKCTSGVDLSFKRDLTMGR